MGSFPPANDMMFSIHNLILGMQSIVFLGGPIPVAAWWKVRNRKGKGKGAKGTQTTDGLNMFKRTKGSSWEILAEWDLILLKMESQYAIGVQRRRISDAQARANMMQMRWSDCWCLICWMMMTLPLKSWWSTTRRTGQIGDDRNAGCKWLHPVMYAWGFAVGLGFLVMEQKSSPIIWKKKNHRMAHALTLQDHKGINTGWWISKNSPTGQADELKVCMSQGSYVLWSILPNAGRHVINEMKHSNEFE